MVSKNCFSCGTEFLWQSAQGTIICSQLLTCYMPCYFWWKSCVIMRLLSEFVSSLCQSNQAFLQTQHSAACAFLLVSVQFFLLTPLLLIFEAPFNNTMQQHGNFGEHHPHPQPAASVTPLRTTPLHASPLKPHYSMNFNFTNNSASPGSTLTPPATPPVSSSRQTTILPAPPDPQLEYIMATPLNDTTALKSQESTPDEDNRYVISREMLLVFTFFVAVQRIWWKREIGPMKANQAQCTCYF